MKKSKASANRKLPGGKMPSKIAGHKERASARPTAAPLLAYHGGPLLANVKVATIYWGSHWASDPLRTLLDEFFNFIVSSPLVDQLAEYSAGGQAIGRGSHISSLLDTSEPGAAIDDAQIQQFLRQRISGKSVPGPDANTVYFVFMPPGTTVTLQGAKSCQQFCGYHDATPDGSIIYAVDTYDDCPGCQFAPGDLIGSSTIVASHELCEAITDPQLNAWFDDTTGEEIGDICEGSNKVLVSTGAQAQAGPASGQGTSVVITPSSFVIGSDPVTVTVTLTPLAAPQPGPPPPQPPPPPPAPPPAPGRSWVVQKEWSNRRGACL